MLKQLFGATLLAMGPISGGGGGDTLSEAVPPTGLEFVRPEQLRSVPLADLPFSGTLPKRADLSEHMPTPGYQGRQNSCVAWVSAYALKTYQEKIEQRYNLTRSGQPDMKKIFSPAFVYNQINQGRDGGATLVDALNLLSGRGALSWSEMPYVIDNFTRLPSAKQLQSARRYRIAYWRQVNVADANEVKAHLNAGYPILIGAAVDDSLFKLKAGRVWERSSGKSLGGHAMIAVGYDDRRKAFKVMNSWGNRWADGGFGWINYRQFAKVVREGYVAKDAPNDRPVELVHRHSRPIESLESRTDPPVPQPGSPEAGMELDGNTHQTNGVKKDGDARKITTSNADDAENQPAPSESPRIRGPRQTPDTATSSPNDITLANTPENTRENTPETDGNLFVQSEESLVAPVALTRQRIEKGELVLSGEAEAMGEGNQAQVLVKFSRDAKGHKRIMISDQNFALPDGTAVAISPSQAVGTGPLQWEARIPLSLLPSGQFWAQPVLYLDRFGVESGEPVLIRRP